MRIPGLVLLASLFAAAPGLAQIESPRLDSAGRIRWGFGGGIARSEAADSLIALRVRARAASTGGNAGVADSLWSAVARAFPFWGSQATRERVALAVGRGAPAVADSLLAAADRAGWPDADRADVLARRATLRLDLGDRAQAIELARQTIRRYPSLAAASRALALLEGAAGRAGLSPEDDRAAVEVEFLRSDRAAAARRLARMFAHSTESDRWRLALREAEVLRAGRDFDGARAALTRALHAARDPAARLRIVLERARARRDGGASDSALADFAAAERSAETVVRNTARWERARELESRAMWEPALAAYAIAAREDSARASDAAFRSGIMTLAGGATRDSALAWFSRATGDAARFWYATLLRPRAIMVADTTLRALAHAPVYSIYTLAARDSLGLGGWRDVEPARPDSARGALAIVAALIANGETDDAITLLDRWALGDVRLQPPLGPGPSTSTAAMLAAAGIADAVGRYGLGIRIAQQALDGCAGCSPSTAWSLVPWRYPPAFEHELARAESLHALQNEGRVPDRALLWAVSWQESRFNPNARSRSNALGLFQLKRATAGDVAGWLHERPPSEEALLEPARSVRLGARYLQHLTERFGGDTLLAVAAYNAGPGTIERWRAVRAWGDRALDCELIARPETEDYVKRVLSVRQAYRELSPGFLGP